MPEPARLVTRRTTVGETALVVSFDGDLRGTARIVVGAAAMDAAQAISVPIWAFLPGQHGWPAQAPALPPEMLLAVAGILNRHQAFLEFQAALDGVAARCHR